jgi:hypothetical protein
LYQSVKPMHSFYKQLTNEIKFSCKGNGAFRWSAIWAILSAYSCPSRSLDASGRSCYFMRETLCLLQTCDGYVLAYPARRFALNKDQFKMILHIPDRNQNRMDCSFFGTARSSEEPGMEQI